MFDTRRVGINAYVFVCVSVLVQLLLELQSELSYRFVLEEIHKQVRQTHLEKHARSSPHAAAEHALTS